MSERNGAAPTSALEELLDLARSASEESPTRVLEVVAETILRTAGYGAVVLNLFRPAWDDYEVVLVVGNQDSREALFGTTTPREVIDRLLADGDEQLPRLYRFTDTFSPVWREVANVYVPDARPSHASDAWRPEDTMIVLLVDADGGPLGFVSVDDPWSGRRPTRAALRRMRVICTYAEHALRSARRTEKAEQEAFLLSQLSEISRRSTTCDTRAELRALVVDAISDSFGFERAAVYVYDDEGRLRLACGRRWCGEAVLSDRARGVIDAAKASAHEEGGCWLLDAASVLDAPVGSRLEGRGPRAWSGDLLLLVPWKDSGVVLVADPRDRLRPSMEHRRTLRLLVDHAAAVQGGIDQRAALDHLAAHDALTGVRNRRDLDAIVDGRPCVAVLLCDLDHFKVVNDRHGHEIGDRVLAAFGELLRELARRDDVPVRLGGEEFCIVLPHTDRNGALAAAERLRTMTLQRLATLIPGGVTVSVGISLSGPHGSDTRSLLAAADRALYQAKRDGRDQTVVHD